MSATRSPTAPAGLANRLVRAIQRPVGTYHAARISRTWGRSDEDHLFLLGVPRAGTSLLATVLACNEALVTVGDETQFFLLRNYQYMSLPGLDDSQWQDMIRTAESKADLFDKIATFYLAQKPSARRFFEKTPGHALHLTDLAKAFPNAQFVFSVRDPRDAFASMKRAKNLPKPSLERYCEFFNEICDRYLDLDEDRVHLVPYEALVTNPGSTVEATCRFLGIDYEERMLDPEVHAQNAPIYGEREHHKRIGQPITPKSIGSWQGTLTAEEVAVLERECSERLAKMGYNGLDHPATRPAA